MSTSLNDIQLDPQARLRRAYVAAVRDFERQLESTLAAGGSYFDVQLDLSPFMDLRCGALGKRTGKPCPHTGLYRNGRCRWHGGLSTGPKTADGKLRSARNVLFRWDVEHQPVASGSPQNSEDNRNSAAITVGLADKECRGPSWTGDQKIIHKPDADMPTPKPTPDYISPHSGQPTQPVGTKGILGSMRSAIEAAGAAGLSITSLQRLTGQPREVMEAGVRLLCTMGVAERKERAQGAIRYVQRGHIDGCASSRLTERHKHLA